jgi:acyl-CoA thioesterase FadM
MNTGKPYIEKENVDVSFSHDDDFAICVIGDHNQGCDILPIENRSIEQWLSIYPFDGVSLIKDLQDQGDTLSIAGSRIWTCFESAKKASGEAVRHIKILKRVGQVVELIAYSELSAYKVITIPVQLTLEIPRMVAFVIEVQKKEKEIMNVPQSTVDVSHQISNTFGYIDPNFGFVYRFPLIFEDSSTISRRVNFSSYSKWVGKVRELFIADIMEKVKEQVASGAWGMATNFNQTEVFGEAKSDDVIEAHFQLKSIQDESYVEFVCYWNKVLENGELELIAISRQGMTWVEIAGHGIIKKSPFPAYFRQFLEDRFTSSMKRKPARKSKSLSSDKLGEKLYEIKTTPDNRVILQEKVFETSLEDSNLVGNIYFSNYTVWQGVLRDQYFYHLAPELYKGIGDQGEWITISNDIQHLREAMPFDTILVEMSLAERYEYGIKLYFDYFKLDSNGTRRKLSFGIQQVVWMKRDEHGNPHPAAIPREISMKLDKSKFY